MKENKLASKLLHLKEYAFIFQIIANITVLISLAFAFYQFAVTRVPIKQNQLLQRAEAFVNLGEYEKAISIYKELARKDVSVAQNNLGYLYEEGLGTKRDFSKAQEYYKSAAENGNRGALNSLVKMYFENPKENPIDELASIFQSAHKLRNQELIECAVSYVEERKLDDAMKRDIEEGGYDYLFEDDMENLKYELSKIDQKYVRDEWEFEGDYYFLSSAEAYTGADSKMVFVGAKTEKFDNGYSGILYHYQKYEKGMKCTENLDTGFIHMKDLYDAKKED